MTGEVVRFPTRRRVLDRLGLDRRPEEADIAALDAEIRRINNAIHTLAAQKIALLARYRAAMRRAAEARNMAAT